MVSQKCQYALRAIFELARQAEAGRQQLKINTIAKAQFIPVRFLENILNQLRGGGFVESTRGRKGGYRLVRDPAGLTLGEIIRFVDGPIGPIPCTDESSRKCQLRADCVFLDIWLKARKAMEKTYDEATFAYLLAADRKRREQSAAHTINYHI